MTKNGNPIVVAEALRNVEVLGEHPSRLNPDKIWGRLERDALILAAAYRHEKAAGESAESERDVLREIVRLAKLAVGDHHAPKDCYATSSLTGEPIEDLLVCPACRFLEAVADYESSKGASNE